LMFVPSDAVAVIVLQPKRLVTSSLFPPQLLALAGKNDMGFDLHDLEQAMLVFGQPGGNAGGQPDFAFVLRFARPIDTTALAVKLVPRGSDTQIEGKRGRVSTVQSSLSCAVVDERTMLVAEESGLHWALSAKATDSPLRKLLTAADDSPEVQA